eukprot:4712777-Alexandrium_andersonii.AAC.1
MELAMEQRPRRLWFSLPCTAWGSMQNASQKDIGQVFALSQKRKQSKKMARAVTQLVDWYQDKEKDVGIFWEWPHCCQ